MLTSCNAMKAGKEHLTIDNERTLCGELVHICYSVLKWDCEECTKVLNEILEQLESVEFMKGKGWIKT
jgi:hypothetical protein